MALRRIVVVSRQAEIHQLARQVAQETFVADDLADALDITETVNPDLVVFDHQFSPPHIREFLNILLKHNRSLTSGQLESSQNVREAAENIIEFGI